MNEIRLNDYCDLVRSSQVTSIDWQNYIENATNDLNKRKLELMLQDVGDYLKKFKSSIKNEIHHEKRLLNGDKPQYNFQTKNPRNVRFRLIKPEDYYAKEIGNILKFKELILKNLKHTRHSNDALLQSDLDFQDERVIKTAEKLIHLKELGVLDFLITKEPFSKSVNKLAIALAPIIGERKGTIQPTLNSIIKENFDKNNPYFQAEDKVAVVKDRLNSLGYIG